MVLSANAMKFQDISQDTADRYQLKENEQCVFFMLNRSGTIAFELAGRGAQAYIFAFFVGKKDESHSLHITQSHLARETRSHSLIRSVVSDQAQCAYEGLISLTKNASQSDASQESRALLLSPDALVSMKPILEILANDVACRHAATASPLSREALFFAQSRGLSRAQATTLLINGFFNDALEKIEGLGIDTQDLREKISSQLAHLNTK